MFSLRVPIEFDSSGPIVANHGDARQGAMIKVPAQWRELTVIHETTGEPETVKVRIAGFGSAYVTDDVIQLVGAGNLTYTIGPHGDFDLGDIMLPSSPSLTLNFALDVQHTLKVEVPPGGSRVELVPQGGWQSWLTQGRKPTRLFRDQTFNISASSRFKMQLQCQYVLGNTCSLNELLSGDFVPLNVGVSLPHGLTDAGGQPVNRRPLRLDGSGTQLFMPGIYVDRKPGTLHFEIPASELTGVGLAGALMQSALASTVEMTAGGYCGDHPEYCEAGVFSILLPVRFRVAADIPAMHEQRRGPMFRVPSSWRDVTVVHDVTGESETLRIRVNGVGAAYTIKKPLPTGIWQSTWVNAPPPCGYGGVGYGTALYYAFFWRVPADAGVCAKQAQKDITQDYQFAYENTGFSYELATPNPLKMSAGTYRGVLNYTVGPHQDFDMGDVMLPDDDLITLNFTLDVEHTLKVDIPPGGNKRAAVVKLSVTLPNGLTDTFGQPVTRRPLHVGQANAQTFNPGFYVDRAPGTLHFEISPYYVDYMIKPGEPSKQYSGNIIVIWDSEV
eukprot:gene5960-5829_t